MKRAFTLIELIVSLSLVSVVILGIFSINSVLSNNNQDYGQRYAVKSETQVTLDHILKNASLAVGDAATDSYGNSEQGILIGTAWGDPNSFCIHQDIPSGSSLDTTVANDPAGAPPNYPNSRWLCYTWNYTFASVIHPYQIGYCSMAYNDSGAGTRGAASCNGVGNTLYLGTAYSSPAASATFNSATGFSITLQNCLNNSASSCLGSSSTDPANNPQVQLSGSVIPAQESF